MAIAFAVAMPMQLAEVERLMRSAFTPYVRALGREIEADAYAWFVDAIGRGDIHVALDGTEIVGAIATRRRGDYLEPVARAVEVRMLSLMTAEMMQDRVRLYERHGFRVVRRGPPEHGKDSHVRVYMAKTLRAP